MDSDEKHFIKSINVTKNETKQWMRNIYKKAFEKSSLEKERNGRFEKVCVVFLKLFM
jgi:hypothetical protein